MRERDFDRLLHQVVLGDMDAWEPALREAIRKGFRRHQLELVRIRSDEDDHEWELPTSGTDGLFSLYGVELCWDSRVARLFATDCAEHVLHLFEVPNPYDMRPREAIAVARRYAMGDATKGELSAAEHAVDDAAEGLENIVPQQSKAAFAAAWSAYWIAGVAAYEAKRVAAWAARLAAESSDADEAQWPDMTLAKMKAHKVELAWQQGRLAQYLLGEVIPCWSE